jgi:hypothetical protein
MQLHHLNSEMQPLTCDGQSQLRIHQDPGIIKPSKGLY